MPFAPREPRSPGAVSRVIDPNLCGTHRATLERAVVRGDAPALVLETWGVIR